MFDSGDYEDNEEDNQIIVTRKYVRNGSVIKCIEYTSIYDGIVGTEIKHRVVWSLDLMIFIQIPFILLILTIWILAMHEKYQECMELFNKFFFCAVK